MESLGVLLLAAARHGHHHQLRYLHSVVTATQFHIYRQDALLLAAQAGHMRIFQELVQWGAQINEPIIEAIQQNVERVRQMRNYLLLPTFTWF